MICERQDTTGVRSGKVLVLVRWPDHETVAAGPYLSFVHALTHARRLATSSLARIWRFHPAIGLRQEQYEEVTI